MSSGIPSCRKPDAHVRRFGVEEVREGRDGADAPRATQPHANEFLGPCCPVRRRPVQAVAKLRRYDVPEVGKGRDGPGSPREQEEANLGADCALRRPGETTVLRGANLRTAHCAEGLSVASNAL